MTFRGQPGNPAGPPFQTDGSRQCLVLGSSNATVSLYMVQNYNNTTNNYTLLSLSHTAQLDFFGHRPGWFGPHGSQGESDNGVQAILTNNCNGKLGVTFLPEPNSGSAFYKDHDGAASGATADEDGSHSLRFQDTSCTNIHPSPGSYGDVDNCERLSNLYINANPTANPKSGTKWTCIDGECEVRLDVLEP